MPIIIPAIPQTSITYLNNTQFSTIATTATLEKTFRFTDVNIKNVYISAWNATSSAITTISVNVDGGANSTVTTSATTETLLNISNIAVPVTSGLHTFNLYLSTSNASYSAYTQFLEVIS